MFVEKLSQYKQQAASQGDMVGIDEGAVAKQQVLRIKSCFKAYLNYTGANVITSVVTLFPSIVALNCETNDTVKLKKSLSLLINDNFRNAV